MKISEMDNETLMRHLVVAKRELKTLQSEIKQIETEIETRFDNGILVKKEE